MMEKVIQFLKSNVIGKVLFTDDIVYKLDNGNLEGIYNDQMVFSNLVRTENGLKFSMTTVTHELIYNLDENGVRSTLVKEQVQVCFATNWLCVKVQIN